MKRLTVLFIATASILTVSWLPGGSNKKQSIRLKQLTSTIKSDTTGVIEAIIWNGERDQLITIDCTVGASLFQFTGKVYPNDRNVTLYYSGQIKLK